MDFSECNELGVREATESRRNLFRVTRKRIESKATARSAATLAIIVLLVFHRGNISPDNDCVHSQAFCIHKIAI